MPKLKRLIILSLTLVLCLLISSAVVTRHQSRAVYREVCDLVFAKFYEKSTSLGKWVNDCHAQVDTLSIKELLSTDSLLSHIRQQLKKLSVSHLDVYSPPENRALWKGQETHTGILARLIDGSWVVYRVIAGSSAQVEGVRVGDVIDYINGQLIRSRGQVSHSKGAFQLTRGGEEPFLVNIIPSVIVVDHRPKLTEWAEGVAVLDLPSFRKEYLAKGEWLTLARSLNGYKKVIIDLRDNSGGSFVGMLRALSPFLCAPSKVGVLVRPRKSRDETVVLEDNADEQAQLSQLESGGSILLQSYAGYGCYRGELRVLVNSRTRSVAEIFAHAIRARARTQVLGAVTAGDVVMAVWYSLPRLGAGYSLSIPEANYVDGSGYQLEGQGVWPQRELKYDLDLAQRGVDSWVQSATVH